ncbi:MAG: DUF5667 domain-containing protein [Parcubacteria group bacterium]
MKIKILFSAFAVVFALGFGLNVSAAEAAKSGAYSIQKLVEEKAGILKPGVLPNSFWYWADIYGEQIGFLFTFAKENKIDYLIGEAGERLAEMKQLSDAGITKYADDLLKRHDGEVKLASELLQQLRDESAAKAEEAQKNLEKRILFEQSDLERRAAEAPSEYDKGVDKAVGSVISWMKNVVSHLNWKRGEITKQKAELSE